MSRRGMAGIGTGLRRRPRAKWAGHRACGRVVTTLIYVFSQIKNIVLERHFVFITSTQLATAAAA